MTSPIDELLDRITALSSEIDNASLSPAARQALVDKRESLRDEARAIADEARHPASIAAEIEMLEARLEEIDGFLITKGHSEKYLSRTIQDPSAYSMNINARLDDHHEDEVATIRHRLERLRSLAPVQDQES